MVTILKYWIEFKFQYFSIELVYMETAQVILKSISIVLCIAYTLFTISIYLCCMYLYFTSTKWTFKCKQYDSKWNKQSERELELKIVLDLNSILLQNRFGTHAQTNKWWNQNVCVCHVRNCFSLFFVTFHKRHFISITYHGAGGIGNGGGNTNKDCIEGARDREREDRNAAAVTTVDFIPPYVVQYCADLHLFDCCYRTLFATINIKWNERGYVMAWI